MKNTVRLSVDVKPERYVITVQPDLQTFKFSGKETIHLNLKNKQKKLVLHARDLKIKDVLFSSGKFSFKPKKIYFDKQSETVTFSFRKDLPAGKSTLALKFSGIMNDSLHGLYRSSYENQGKKEYLAVTQFESIFARRAFPCFDEPAAKAIFEVTMVVPKKMTAISNTVEAHIQEKGKNKIVKFEPTPRMSTYLLAFIVGNFEFIQAKTKHGVLIRVFVTPGKKHQAKFALDVAIKALDFFDNYFAIPYPLPILDLVAIPDFAAGAMENWGAVTYRETSLLIDVEHSSVTTKQRVAITVIHELAHQWFGNLVTMDWWTDLWLNEGFATYCEYLVASEIFPEWNMWEQFVFEDLGGSLKLDSLKNSHPIEVEVRHPREIDEIFDAVSYSKGASIIRMLADYIGPKDFRDGLRYYLRKFAYKNAVTKDLWKAFEHVSGKNVSGIMNTWTKQAGYPLVSIEYLAPGIQYGNKDQLILTQEQFFSSPLSAKQNKLKLLWKVPVSIARGDSKKIEKLLLNGKEIKIAVPKKGEWLKLNPDQSGFYRVSYPSALLQQLEPLVSRQKLNAADRLGLVSDAFALAEAGKIRTTDVLKLLSSYAMEKNFTVMIELSAGVNHLATVLEDHPFYSDYENFVRNIYSGLATELGWDKKQKETHVDALLRQLVLNNAGKFGDKTVLAKAKKLFAGTVRGKPIDPDIRGIVYDLVAYQGGQKEYQQLLKLYRNAKLHEEKHRILRAIANFKDKRILNDVLRFMISDQVRMQDSAIFIGGVYANKNGKDIAWQFMKKNWNALLKRYGGGGLFLSRLLEHLSVFSSDATSADIKKFFKAHKHQGAERSLKQSLEQIRSNAAWLQRDKDLIKTWLTDHSA